MVGRCVSFSMKVEGGSCAISGEGVPDSNTLGWSKNDGAEVGCIPVFCLFSARLECT
jgi:hypothetical protein